ncbi:MAG TPA: hypothetical protein VGE97_01215, partial [Nitrososphaera sp.]
MRIYSGYAGNVTRCLAAAICLISAKESFLSWGQSEAPPGMLIYAWKEAISFRIFIASLIVLVGAILMYRIALLGALSAMLWILWEFAQWYELSYRGFRNPHVGDGVKQYTLGLWQASWWHALILVCSLMLVLLIIKLL